MNEQHDDAPAAASRVSSDAAALRDALLRAAADGRQISIVEAALELKLPQQRVLGALAEIGREALARMGVAPGHTAVIGIPGAEDVPITLDALMRTMPQFDPGVRREITHKAALEDLAKDPRQSLSVRLGAASAAGATLCMHPDTVRRLVEHATAVQFVPPVGSTGQVAIHSMPAMRAGHVLVVTELQVPANGKLALVQLQISD